VQETSRGDVLMTRYDDVISEEVANQSGITQFKDIKLVALDLDGTTLDDELRISQRTIEAIKDLINRGIYVTFVSGRTYRAAEYVRKNILIDIPVVAYNGAKVVIPSKDEVYSIKIPLGEAMKIIKFGEEKGMYVKVYIDDVLHVKEDDQASKAFSISNGIEYKVVGKLSENINEDVNMIVMYFNEHTNEGIADMLKDVDVTITMSTDNSIDVIPKGVSKDKGLKLVADHLNINRDKILAVGNSMNDIEMLRFAGIGIAMKNADSGLLKQWDNVSEFTNNEEGVYHILKHI
jgi:5-amino-6-(5-phospho-D-ribitylamino)uracil phosphatase